jgi:predicted DNA-binding transcriptional regulator AlpA
MSRATIYRKVRDYGLTLPSPATLTISTEIER